MNNCGRRGGIVILFAMLLLPSLACGTTAEDRGARATLRPTFTPALAVATLTDLPTPFPTASVEPTKTFQSPTPFPTETSLPPTETSLPPTETSIPPTDTPSPPTDTPPPPTESPIPPTDVPQPTQPPQADVAIVDVVNAGYAEHVVIRNRGGAPAEISGWRLAEEDLIIEPFIFPAGVALAPGAEVRIYSGRDGRQHNPPASFSWTEKNVWDNDGETARLFDAQGNLVSDYRYR